MNSPADPQSSRLAEAKVSDYATTGILSVESNAPLERVAYMMASNRIHAVAVVDDEAPEPPVIRDVDLVTAAASGHFGELRARDIAGTDAVSVHDDERLDRAAELLAEHGISHLIVRDHRHVPAGVLSTVDIACAISGREPISHQSELR
jgi:predicted transcriptional regulator